MRKKPLWGPYTGPRAKVNPCGNRRSCPWICARSLSLSLRQDVRPTLACKRDVREKKGIFREPPKRLASMRFYRLVMGKLNGNRVKIWGKKKIYGGSGIVSLLGTPSYSLSETSLCAAKIRERDIFFDIVIHLFFRTRHASIERKNPMNLGCRDKFYQPRMRV